MLSIKDITKIYTNPSGEDTKAVDGISCEFAEKGMVFIQGKSGCGKTTLLNLLAVIDKPTSGKIKFNDICISELSEDECDNYRNLYMGMIFQDYMLLNSMSVYENISISLNIQSWEGKTKEDVDIQIKDILEYVGLEDKIYSSVSTLSGGQKQRVAIARALIKSPYVVLADEPTGNLDETNSEQIFTLLRKIADEKLVIIVTHNEEAAKRFGDRIITMRDGKIVSDYKNECECYNTIQYEMELKETGLITENINDIKKDIIANMNDECAKEYTLSVKKKHSKVDKTSVKMPQIYGKEKQAKLLTIKEVFGIFKELIKKKKIRVVITTVLISLTFFLLLAGVSISSYDVTKPIKEYVDNYDIKNMFVSQEVKFNSVEYGEMELDVKNGKIIGECLENSVGKENVVRYMEDCALSVYNEKTSIEDYNELYDITPMICSDNLLKDRKISGKYPYGVDEIAITDYVADKLKLTEQDLGTLLELESKQYILTGIVDTDYEDYGLERKLLKSGIEGLEADYMYRMSYSVVYLNENYFNEIKKLNKWLYLDANLVFYDNLDYYADNQGVYGTIENFTASEDELCAGRFPTKSNEILMSLEMAEILGYNQDNPEEFFSEKITIPNVKGTGYSNSIDLIEYFGEEVEVVGVYSQGYAGLKVNHVHFVVNDEVYKKMESDYYEYFMPSGFGICCDEDNRSDIIDVFKEKNIRIKEPALSKVYSLNDSINNLKLYCYLALIILVCITALIILSLISYSIKDNSKIIGILRSIGMTKRDTIRIFIIETLIITLISIVVGIFSCVLGLVYINDRYIIELGEKTYNIWHLNYISLTSTIVVMCAYSILSIIIPIRSLAKKKPVDIIRNN